MSLKILFITATSSEAYAFQKIEGMNPASGGYRFRNTDIHLLITGVGSMATAWTMKQWLSENDKPSLVINAGIAGSYKDEFVIGDIVMPLSDCFADSGIEDGDNFLTLREAGISSGNEVPFTNGLIMADNWYSNFFIDILKPVRAITVNTVTGSEQTKQKLIKKYNPDIETMEGATFFYICAREKLPFLAIRAISNMVETRNRNNWNIELALDSLAEKIKEILIRLE